MLDRLQQFGVFLAHDLVELRGPHSRFLHLLERPSGIHALMLAGISDDENSVSGLSFSRKPHLPVLARLDSSSM